jgi:DNA-directed RNA polymerase subunit RPC12/RpoP
MWECSECGHCFSVASASSLDQDDEIVPGVECPECGAFVSDEDTIDDDE